jgi:hypothetical protein
VTVDRSAEAAAYSREFLLPKMTLVECDHSTHHHVSKVPFTMRKYK